MSTLKNHKSQAQRFAITDVTSTQQEPSGDFEAVSKHYGERDGELVKHDTKGRLVRANFRTEHFAVADMEGVLNHIHERPHNHLLINGVCGIAKGRITTKLRKAKDFSNDDSVITRSLEHFRYPDGFTLHYFDYDPDDEGPALIGDALIKELRRICPEFEEVTLGWCVSASSCIIGSDGVTEHRGIKGQRIYFILNGGEHAKRVLQSVCIRMAEAGHAFLKQRVNGHYDNRTIFDASTASPERCNYIGQPKLDDGLSQEKPAPVVYPGKKAYVDAADVPGGETTFADWAKTAVRFAALRGDPTVKEKSAWQRKSWAKEKAGEHGGTAVQWERHALKHMYPSDAPIMLQDGRETTFDKIEANPEQFADEYCADPHEPNEGLCRAVIRVRDDGTVLVHSFLHGGQDYYPFVDIAALLDGADTDADGTRKKLYSPAVKRTFSTMDEGEQSDVRFKIKHAVDEKGRKLLSVTDWDKAIKSAPRDADGPEGPAPDETTVQQLMRLATAARLFRDQHDQVHADVFVHGRRQTWRLRSKGFRNWLTQQFYAATKGAPRSDDLRNVLDGLEARAAHEGAPQRKVCLRVANCGEAIYIDLCDEEWRAIEVTAGGWQIVDQTPDTVRFTRHRANAPLVIPKRGGTIDQLRGLINFRSETDFILGVCWALGCLSGLGPYVLAVFTGSPGAAKTSAVRVLRTILDPNTTDVRRPPDGADARYLEADKTFLLAWDNVSGLAPKESDDLCAIATGSSISKKTLYTDDDQTILNARNPVLCNGVPEFVTRSDLADRSVVFTLERLSDDRRMSERRFKATLARDAPYILGALLDGLVEGLTMLDTVDAATLPRMADWGEWCLACETAFWPEGTFANALIANRDVVHEQLVQNDPVARELRAFMNEPENRDFIGQWEGSLDQLLRKITPHESDRRGRGWPETTRGLVNVLRRILPALDATVPRIEIQLGVDRRKEEGGSQNDVRITWHPPDAEQFDREEAINSHEAE